MKKVTEQDLNQKVNSLRDYINVIEAYAPGTNPVPTKAPAPAAPAAPAPAPAGAQSGWDQFKTWATTPIVGDKSAAAQGAKPLSFGQSTATAAKPAAPASAKPAPARTPDPKVMAIQNELIKRGAKIKADGIMGPATQAAQQQFATGGPGAAAPGAAPGAAPAVDPLQASIDQNAAWFKMNQAQRAAADAAVKNKQVSSDVQNLFGKQAPPPPRPAQAAAQAVPAGLPGAQTSAQAEKAAITPAFASQAAPAAPAEVVRSPISSRDARDSQDYVDSTGKLTHANPEQVRESVTFGYDQELARIISLTRR